ALVLVVTDPPDPLADATRRLGHDRVLSTGTYLDSLRFRFHLARRLGVSPAFVDAQILGEHGTSGVRLVLCPDRRDADTRLGRAVCPRPREVPNPPL
ncbi:MAG: hypothetical protein WA633_14640, partial [Stellaceae bacterium]